MRPDLDAETLQAIALTKQFTLWQRRAGHRTATDDVLCAWAGAQTRPRARQVLDLGAGHGAVTLMLAGALPQASITAIEAQALSAALLSHNIKANGLETRVSARHGDLRQVQLDTEHGFELITGSPPFMPLGSGTLPQDSQRAAARFELRGGVEAYCQAAQQWLAEDGAAVILMDGAQDERCRVAIHQAHLHHERSIVVIPRVGSRPRYRIYVMTRRPCDRSQEETLTVRDEHGDWTEDFREVRARLALP